MPAAAASAEAPAVEQPRHPLHAPTTYELSGYRRQLERAIAYFGQQQAALDAVLAEQDDRTTIAHA